MTGSILQLLSSNGMNTIYLIGSPQITYFKSVYRRYTNFSIFEYVKYHNSLIKPGGEIIFDIETNADILTNLVLQVDLPENIILKQSLNSHNIVQNILAEHEIKFKKNDKYKEILSDVKNDPKFKTLNINSNIKKNIDYDNDIVPLINNKIECLIDEINFNKLLKLKKQNVEDIYKNKFLTDVWIKFIVENMDIMLYDYVINIGNNFKSIKNELSNTFQYITENISTNTLLIDFFSAYLVNINDTFINYKKLINQLLCNNKEPSNTIIEIMSLSLTQCIIDYIEKHNLNNSINSLLNNLTENFIVSHGSIYIYLFSYA